MGRDDDTECAFNIVKLLKLRVLQSLTTAPTFAELAVKRQARQSG
jgi:hypothetical protein